MRHHPAPVDPLDAPLARAIRIGGAAPGGIGLVLAALIVSTGPLGAQTRQADGDTLRDPLRRPTLRATTPGTATAITTPRATAVSPLRGTLDVKRGATPTPVDPVPPPAALDPLAPGDGLADPEPATLEPIGRPASASRIAASTSTANGADPGAAARATAGRIDPATGRPLVLAPEGGRGPVEAARRLGSVKGGPIPAEAARQPRPRDPNADKRDEALAEDEAYAPLGLRSGGFTWLPAVESSAGWSSNVASRAGGASGGVWRVAPELTGRSDWSRHSLQIELRGAYIGNTTDHDYDKPTFQGALRGRIDLGEETTVDVRGGWSHDRQSASNADNPANTVVPATVDSKSLSLGVTRDAGLLAVTLRGDLDRSDYSGGTTASGASLGSEIQNNTRYTAALRAAYGSKGSIRPFVEVQASKRAYDEATVAGSPRDSTGAAAKVGVVADLGPKLRGELSTGWGVERLDKGTLPDMSGWLLDGSLVWSPTRLTSVRLDAKSSFDATTLAASPGAVTRTVAIAVDHTLQPRLVASAGVAITDKRYVGTTLREDTMVLSSGLTYKVDRNIHTFVKGSLTRFSSSSAGADYDAASVMVGLRLQR